MKKSIGLLIALCCILICVGCGTVPQVPVEEDLQAPPSESNAAAMEIYNSLYMGEAFPSGYVYLEPFCLDRETFNEESYISSHPDTIVFLGLEAENTAYTASYDDKFGLYVPEKEPDSTYFSQAFSAPVQYGLRYKLKELPGDTLQGVALFGWDITKIDCSVKGEPRPYSDKEYQEAQALVAKDQGVSAQDRTLDYITLDNTLTGAKKLCRIYLQDKETELLISEYNTHDAEYAAHVYVLDIIKDGKQIRSFEKYNWDGPY